MLVCRDLSCVVHDAIVEHLSVVRQLDMQQDALKRVAAAMSRAVLAGNTIFWCGNGGSAADAQHLAAELVGRFRCERRPVASVALTADSSVMTAIANDYGYDEVFSRQIEALCSPDDVVVGISTSGDSANVCTVPIYRHELLAALTQDVVLSKEEKVLPLDRLLWRVAAWRASGQRVVFTNGCFDLLHIGHITLLEEARRKGDRLIVAVNSDDSVRRLKGLSRPLVAAADRAQILAALHVVDAVVVFDEDTPLQLIETIRPDVLVKGGDYAQEDVVGASQVKSWGGAVELVPNVEGASTTGLIEKAMSYAHD